MFRLPVQCCYYLSTRSLQLSTQFPPWRQTPYAGTVKLCWSFGVLRAFCVSAFRRLQNGVLWEHPSGSRRVLNRDFWGRKKKGWFIFLFAWNLRIAGFTFCNICAYRSELILTPLFNNSAYKVSSVSQKTLVMTSPAEVCTLNTLSLIHL